jgi:hypothetical protein
MELMIEGDSDAGVEDEFILIKVGYVWMEDVKDDMHIQFNGPGDDNYLVPFDANKGFIIPHPADPYKTTFARHVAFLDKPGISKHRKWASTEYVMALRKLWPCPNQ